MECAFVTGAPHAPGVLFTSQDGSLQTILPYELLLDQSLQIVSTNTSFNSWSTANDVDCYRSLRWISEVWEKCHIASQYLVYANTSMQPFHFEIVPFQKCRTPIGRAFQQIQVLSRTVFGGIVQSKEDRESQLAKYALLFRLNPLTNPSPTEDILPDPVCPFCNEETVARQSVITGEKVHVLFNYAPVGFGGERLHFLIIPNKHAPTFKEVRLEEYSEAMQLSRRLIEHFTTTRSGITNVHLLHKTGADAGQTVNHWHLHLIFASATQDLVGKFHVLKNIVLGATPMEPASLTARVTELKLELASPNNTTSIEN